MEQVPGCLIDSNRMNVKSNDCQLIAWITGQLYAMKFVTEQKKRRRSEVAIEFENKAQFTWMCRWRNTPCDISPLCQKSHLWNNTWIVT